jgi:DNA-binding NtrC family response regulator
MTAILVADNDPGWLQNLTGIVERGGYSVIPATNRKEAMAVIGRHEADVAVLDLRLDEDLDADDISGLQVAEDTDRTIPKIIV